MWGGRGGSKEVDADDDGGLRATWSEGWSGREVQGKHVVGYLSPDRVRNSRGMEPCCW